MFQIAIRVTALINRPILRALLLAAIIHIIVLSQAIDPVPRPTLYQPPVSLSIKLSPPQPPPETVLQEITSVIPPLPELQPTEPPPPVEMQPQPAAQPEIPATETLITEAGAAARMLGRLPDNSEPETIARQQAPVPTNWSRPIISISDNRFAGVWLPPKPQMTDLWKNRDGSQQNKVRLPNGKFVCGRKEATELFEPLVIPIWTYHGC